MTRRPGAWFVDAHLVVDHPLWAFHPGPGPSVLGFLLGFGRVPQNIVPM
jgi:hypothetical protein